MSTNIYKGGGGVQKVQNLVYVENGCPSYPNNEIPLGGLKMKKRIIFKTALFHIFILYQNIIIKKHIKSSTYYAFENGTVPPPIDSSKLIRT